jgi:hypothetical protein
MVLPEHKEHEIKELYQIKLGPGAYDPTHDLVERRGDVGAVGYQDITEKNKRENLMDLAKKDVFDGDLYPNYDFDKPNHGVPILHEPVVLDGPAHVPLSKLHPEQWRFYDPDINAVKPEVGDVLLAGGVEREDYLKKEQDRQVLVDYLNRHNNRKPALGQYDVNYDGIDPERNVPDFERYMERDMEPAGHDKNDREIDGDVLILDPRLPEPHVANVHFGKMQGREEHGPNEEFKEELILHPNHAITEKKVINYVDMKKQAERKTIFDHEVEEFKEEIVLDKNYDAIQPKIKFVPDFKKITGRDDLLQKKPYGDEEVIVNPEHAQTKADNTRTAVRMDKGEIRFRDNQEDNNMMDGRITVEERIDYNKAIGAIKPEPRTIDFKRYAARDRPNTSPKKMIPNIAGMDVLSNVADAQSIDLGPGPLNNSMGGMGSPEQADNKFTRYADKNPDIKNVITPRRPNTAQPRKVSKKTETSTTKLITKPQTSEGKKPNEISPWGNEEIREVPENNAVEDS